MTEASADYNSAALSSAKEKVSANYSYNLSVAEGSVAQEEYEATISELQDAVDEAQEAVDESQALLTYYQEMIDSGMDLSESLADEQGNYDKLYNKLKAAKSAYTTKSVEAEKIQRGNVILRKCRQSVFRRCGRRGCISGYGAGHVDRCQRGFI